MAWSPVGSISLKSDWQYSEPVEGSYFKLQHSGFPLNGSYEIAQAMVNTDGSIELADIQQLQPRPEAQNIYLKAPPIFSSRRIALRRLPKLLTLESELRRVIRDTILRDPEINPFPPKRIDWQVIIGVSDYVEAAGSGAPGGNNTSTTTTKTLTYATDGDANGLCYWVGTNYGIEAWANPHTVGRLAVSSTSIEAGYSSGIQTLVDRANSDFFTMNFTNQRISIALQPGYTLAPDRYSIKSGGDDYPRSWKLQGSNDGATWVDLDTQSNNATLTAAQQWLSLTVNNVSTGSGYRYLGILQTGVGSAGRNYFRLSEIEFYGNLIKTT